MEFNLQDQQKNQYVYNDPSIKKKGSILVIIVLSIFVAVVVGGIVYYLQSAKYKKLEEQLTQMDKILKTNLVDKTAVSVVKDTVPVVSITKPTDKIVSPTLNSLDTYKDWKVLEDTKLGYLIQYPADWTITLQDGLTTKDFVQGEGKAYHYLDLMSADKKWNANIGISKIGSSVMTALRTGVSPIGFPLTKGETIKVGGTDVSLYESLYQKKITEIFLSSLDSNSIAPILNKEYTVGGFLSRIDDFMKKTDKGLELDLSPALTRQSKTYLDYKKMLESIEFVEYYPRKAINTDGDWVTYGVYDPVKGFIVNTSSTVENFVQNIVISKLGEPLKTIVTTSTNRYDITKIITHTNKVYDGLEVGDLGTTVTSDKYEIFGGLSIGSTNAKAIRVLGQPTKISINAKTGVEKYQYDALGTLLLHFENNKLTKIEYGAYQG